MLGNAGKCWEMLGNIKIQLFPAELTYQSLNGALPSRKLIAKPHLISAEPEWCYLSYEVFLVLWFDEFFDNSNTISYYYRDPDEFAEVDARAISVAQEDQKTFTDLVRQLVAGCANDVEKARAIFRWITVKNLNSLMFEEVEGGDTPMGLLRGIKFGTESYHVLFKRLCR